MKKMAIWFVVTVLALVLATSVAIMTASRPHQQTALKLYLDEVYFQYVDSESMEPLIPQGSVVVVQPWPTPREYWEHSFTEPTLYRGTILALDNERIGVTDLYLARIVALAGDRVRFGSDGSIDVWVGGDSENRTRYCESAEKRAELHELFLERTEILVLTEDCENQVDSDQIHKGLVDALVIRGFALYVFLDPFDAHTLYIDKYEDW